MAITTQGFGVNVLPQYTPVDPSLVAFNPAAVTQGIGQGFDVVKGLEQLKLMRQTHEENAKMSAAKNKLLQAQADEAELIANHKNAIQQADIDSKLAKLKHDRAVAESDLPNVTGRANLETGTLKNALDLVPGAGRIGMIQQAGLEKATPFLSDAMVSDAQVKSGASKFALSQQPTIQETQSISNESALDTAPAQAAAARIAADTGIVNAQMALNTAKNDYLKGSTSKERVVESEINLRNAQAKQAEAHAQEMAAKNGKDIQIAQIKAQAKDQMFTKLNNTSKLANELGRLPVVSPSDGAQTTMSQLADKYWVVDGDGNVNVIDKGMFMKDFATMNPSTRADLESYRDLQRLRSILVKDLASSIEGARPSSAPTSAGPVYGKLPNGSYGIITP